VLNVISTIVLARLLSPGEIGIFSVAAVLIGMAQMIREFGVGQYLIKEKKLSAEKIQAAFGLTIAFAWTMGAVLWFIAPAVSRFYNEPGLENVIHVLVINVMLIPFGSVILALLNRELKFDALFRIKAVAALIYTITAISLALLNFGYMSLAWAALGNVIATILMANVYRPDNVPIFPGFREIRPVFAFGYKVTVASLFKEIGSASPDLIIGRILNMDAVGYFSRAMGIITLFRQAVIDGINQILLPHFSLKVRKGENLDEIYLQGMSYILGIAWPFFIFVAILAGPIVNTLFGDQWDASIPIVRILCLYAMIETLSVMYNQILIALGATHKNMRFEIIVNSALVVLLIAGASLFGLEGAAWALVAKALLSMRIIQTSLRSLLSIERKSYISLVKINMQIAIAAMTVPVALYLFAGFHPDSYISTLILSAVGAGFGWMLAVKLLRHPLSHELDEAVRFIGKSKAIK